LADWMCLTLHTLIPCIFYPYCCFQFTHSWFHSYLPYDFHRHVGPIQFSRRPVKSLSPHSLKAVSHSLSHSSCSHYLPVLLQLLPFSQRPYRIHETLAFCWCSP
jgi:hypothetical protein